MTDESLEVLQSKVTDLSQRMCQVEQRQTMVGIQLSDINESLSKFSDETKRRQKFYTTHMMCIGIGSTVLIAIILVLIHMLH